MTAKVPKVTHLDFAAERPQEYKKLELKRPAKGCKTCIKLHKQAKLVYDGPQRTYRYCRKVFHKHLKDEHFAKTENAYVTRTETNLLISTDKVSAVASTSRLESGTDESVGSAVVKDIVSSCISRATNVPLELELDLDTPADSASKLRLLNETHLPRPLKMTTPPKALNNKLTDRQNKNTGTIPKSTRTEDMETDQAETQTLLPGRKTTPKNTNEINLNLDGYQLPKKTTPIKKTLATYVDKPATTYNRYKPIEPTTQQDKETDEHDRVQNERAKLRRTEETSEQEIKRKTAETMKYQKEKAFKPPPIILEGKFLTETNKLIKEIKQFATKEFYIKNTRKSTIVQLDNLTDYNKVLKHVQDQEFSHHTYTPKDGKTHAFVLRGYGHVNTQELKNDLTDLQIIVKNVYIMKNKKDAVNPETNYLVITDAKHTLKDLQTIKVLNHVRIRWERRRQEARITQCMRCQTWGHVATNCRRRIACVICAGEHSSKECTLPKTQPPTCANCRGAHTACNREKCPVYQNKAKYTEAARQETRKQAAPPPPPINTSIFPPLREKTWTSQRARPERPRQHSGEYSYAEVITNTNNTNSNNIPRQLQRQQTQQTDEIDALTRP